jgi:hypothetical protein
VNESDRKSRIETAFVLRFIAFGLVMAFASVVPYLSTRGAYRTDGLEVAGWPLRCYELGGVVGHFYFGPWMMAGDIAIAVVVSALAAWIFRYGVLRTLRKWWNWCRIWGTPHAE